MEDIDSLVEDFCKGKYDFNVSDDAWPHVFAKLANNTENMEFEKDKIHTLWTVNGGHLRRKVKDDALIARVLTAALPGYSGLGLTLYRGECHFLYEANQIGFCWTPKIEVAEMFASGLNSIESGGVLLKAYAPSPSILASPNEHSAKQMQEFEYTCNPNLFEKIELIKTYAKFKS